jgi:xanthine dehydrogenase iron-sulfur cluster and FAD-binding subunit A
MKNRHKPGHRHRGGARPAAFITDRIEELMPKYILKVNGATRTVDADSDTPLLYVLRDDLGLRGPRFGCGLGQCGACTT